MFNLKVNPNAQTTQSQKSETEEGEGYRNFKVYYFLSKSRHIIRETKGIFS